MPHEGEYEACIGCIFTTDGMRVVDLEGGEEAGIVLPGGTCCGYPNGCLTVKDFAWDDVVSISLRQVGKGQPWSKPVEYWMDTAYNDGSTAVVLDTKSHPKPASDHDEF